MRFSERALGGPWSERALGGPGVILSKRSPKGEAPHRVILSERSPKGEASRRISRRAATQHEIPRLRRFAPALEMTKSPMS